MAIAMGIRYSFNTQPPEGGWAHRYKPPHTVTAFQHTAARRRLVVMHIAAKCFNLFQHTAARRRLVFPTQRYAAKLTFQHTAARRRLDMTQVTQNFSLRVSTHSRPKAAGLATVIVAVFNSCFNTQPPEGGWPGYSVQPSDRERFQHTAARRRLE